MTAKHGLPLVPPKEDSEHLKIKHGEQYVAQHIITRKKHGERNLTKGYRMKWE